MSKKFKEVYTTILSEAKDPSEYDNEGGMAKNQLMTVASAAEELHDMIDDDENLPEWCQNKITKATDYLDSVRDYMKAKETEDDPGDENPNEAKVDLDEDLKMIGKKPHPKGGFEVTLQSKDGKKIVRHLNKGKVKTLSVDAKVTEAKVDPEKYAAHAAKFNKPKKQTSTQKTLAKIRAKEEVQLDELSPRTKASYVKKATSQNKSAQKAYDKEVRDPKNYFSFNDTPSMKKNKATMLKRGDGIARAKGKDAKTRNVYPESVETNEVLDTPKAMKSYRSKAKYSSDRAANSAATKILRGPDKDGKRADHSPELNTMRKRRDGEKMADRNIDRKFAKAMEPKSPLAKKFNLVKAKESVDEAPGDQTKRLMSPLQKMRMDKEKKDRDRDGKMKPTLMTKKARQYKK